MEKTATILENKLFDACIEGNIDNIKNIIANNNISIQDLMQDNWDYFDTVRYGDMYITDNFPDDIVKFLNKIDSYIKMNVSDNLFSYYEDLITKYFLFLNDLIGDKSLTKDQFKVLNKLDVYNGFGLYSRHRNVIEINLPEFLLEFKDDETLIRTCIMVTIAHEIVHYTQFKRIDKTFNDSFLEHRAVMISNMLILENIYKFTNKFGLFDTEHLKKNIKDEIHSFRRNINISYNEI